MPEPQSPPVRDAQEDRDILIISNLVENHCSAQIDPEAANETRDALQRLLARIAAADELYAALTTKYRLVWPIAGVLLTGKRRKALVREYDKVRPDPVEQPPAGH